MNYKRKDMCVLAYANGFTLWHYTTADTAATVGSRGYFNSASDLVRVGDMIITNTDISRTAGIFFVSTNSKGVVDVVSLTVHAELSASGLSAAKHNEASDPGKI